MEQSAAHIWHSPEFAAAIRGVMVVLIWCRKPNKKSGLKDFTRTNQQITKRASYERHSSDHFMGRIWIFNGFALG
jgi:phage host-nuclease inhibitor protein Gam